MIIDEENNNIFIIEKLNSLKNELNRDQVNLKSVQRDIKQLENYDNVSQYEYLNSLLDPIKTKSVKIPSQCPIPSCSFQMHNSFSFYPNDGGHDLFYLNPWFLANENIYKVNIPFESSTFHIDLGGATYFANVAINADTSISDPYNWYFPTGSATQVIPDVYAKYRLVSACMTVRYTGALEEACGVMGGAIVYNKSPYLGCRFHKDNQGANWGGTRDPSLSNINFESIRDSYYFIEHNILEGLKMLYFPLDNNFNEFRDVCDGSGITIENVELAGGNSVFAFKLPNKFLNTGFGWACYLLNTPITQQKIFRVDYYLNFECIPKAEFMNYMPVTLNVRPTLSNDLKKKFIDEVQDKAIQKLNIY